MQRAQADLNRLFGACVFSPATEFPSLNLWTSPDGAIIAAEVPGVASEDLDIRSSATPSRARATDLQSRSMTVPSYNGKTARTVLRTHHVLPFRVDADKASPGSERGVVPDRRARKTTKPHQIKVTRPDAGNRMGVRDEPDHNQNGPSAATELTSTAADLHAASRHPRKGRPRSSCLWTFQAPIPATSMSRSTSVS